MERVLAELTETGLLDEETARWVRRARSERGGGLDTVLLELDAVDEETLLRALSARHGIAAASIETLARLDRDLAGRLPIDVSVDFSLCPILFEDYGVVVWVESPLGAERLEELREIVGLDVHQRIAASHHVATARARLYGAPLDERADTLWATLERRRAAADLPATLEAIASAPTLGDAVGAASDFVADRLEVSTFFVEAGGGLRVVGMRGGTLDDSWIGMPEPECTFGAALRYGGYFLGPVGEGDADRRFFASLGRDPARRAFVAPLPTPDGPSVVFFGENGARAISTRLAAEVSLMTARLAQRGESWASLRFDPQPPAAEAAAETSSPPAALEPRRRPAPPESAPPAAAPPAEPAVTEVERGVLERLRTAAAAEGVDLPIFVDRLLSPAAAPASAMAPSALAGEVKELFERLATDIPTQLARGMEAAFRDLAPRIAAGVAPAAPGPADAARPSAAANVELVVKEAGPREVPSYRSRRGKTKRRKL